jgi:hypothetical protein
MRPSVAAALLILGASVLAPTAAQANHRLPNNGHWDRTSTVAHVKFLDYSGPSWPVGTANADWDQADNIDSDWVVADDNSTCGNDCVKVQSLMPADDPLGLMLGGCSGYYGYWTNHNPNSNNHWTDDNKVRFNKSCNDKPYSWRRAMVCQELGHALGLDHESSTESCMYQQPAPAAATPRAHDYGMLNNTIYDH